MNGKEHNGGRPAQDWLFLSIPVGWQQYIIESAWEAQWLLEYVNSPER
jgi:hypothetical protein